MSKSQKIHSQAAAHTKHGFYTLICRARSPSHPDLQPRASSDAVLPETASERQDGNGEKVYCRHVNGRGHKSERLGGGALQVGDLRLLEDGCERGGALVSDPVPSETASQGRSGKDGRASASTALTRKRTLGRQRTSAP